MGTILECSFSLLDTGRKYTTVNRKYVINNARDICYSPETRERIANRECFGFYGHGRRVLCGKVDIQEVDVITLPDGKQAMVSNIPSNVTVAFDVDHDGTVRHKQEILDTEPGRIVEGLHRSRVGGFSWACPGTDGGTKATTVLTGFSGFDYVLSPGFSANRGYVLEATQADMVLECVTAIVGNDARAQQLVDGWRYSGGIADPDEAIFEAANAYYELKGRYGELARKVSHLEQDREEAIKMAVGEAQKRFHSILEGIAEHLPFFISEATMQRLLAGDHDRAMQIFESARRTDFSQFPIASHKCEQLEIEGAPAKTSADYGSAGYGFDIEV